VSTPRNMLNLDVTHFTTVNHTSDPGFFLRFLGGQCDPTSRRVETGDPLCFTP
jgi:hypothetical protein